jgi:hypothetical protein
MIEERSPEHERIDGVTTEIAIPEAEATTSGRPRSPLGRRLREIRERIVASGIPLLDAEQLEAELAERRGDRDDLP